LNTISLQSNQQVISILLFCRLAQTQASVCFLSSSQTKITTWQAALERQQRPNLFSSKHKEQNPSNGTMLPASVEAQTKKKEVR
jgi:hypothetical protein